MPSQRQMHDELEARITQFSTFGATAAGGVHRPEATPANGEARTALVAWLREAGVEVRVDAIGNIFGLMPLAGADAPWLLTGSHVDSQPNGGRFDGTYGVLASTIAALALRDRLSEAGRRPAMNLAVVAWTNEEGARFQPSVLGSSAYVGAIELDWALARVDAAGVSVEDALEAIGFRGTDRTGAEACGLCRAAHRMRARARAGRTAARRVRSLVGLPQAGDPLQRRAGAYRPDADARAPRRAPGCRQRRDRRAPPRGRFPRRCPAHVGRPDRGQAELAQCRAVGGHDLSGAALGRSRRLWQWPSSERLS